MTLLTIAGLLLSSLLTSFSNVDVPAPHTYNTLDIDSTDVIIINLDQVGIFGDIIEVPLMIQSDEVINALDFSMKLNVGNVEYMEVIDHTGDLQVTAFFNTNDEKLRLTSNSFSSYPKDPERVVSVRFKVLSGSFFKSDFQMIVGYLNGDPCKIEIQMQGDEIAVSSKEIITNEIFITPNPATAELYIQSDVQGTLDMFDAQGRKAISNFSIEAGNYTKIDVQTLPRGQYTVRLVTTEEKVKTQKIVLL